MRIVSEGELDAAEAIFKAQWHAADREGDLGNRVRRGLIAVINTLFNERSR